MVRQVIDATPGRQRSPSLTLHGDTMKASSSKAPASEESESLSAQLAKALAINEEQQRTVDRLIKALDTTNIAGQAAPSNSRRVRPTRPPTVESRDPMGQTGAPPLAFDRSDETTDVELVANESLTPKQRVFYVQSSKIERACPGLFQAWAEAKAALGLKIDDDVDRPVRVVGAMYIDTVATCLNYAYSQRYSVSSAGSPFLQQWNVMLLAAEWKMTMLLDTACDQFYGTALAMPPPHLYLLAGKLAMIYQPDWARRLPADIAETVEYAAAARSSEILNDPRSVSQLTQPDSTPLALFYKFLASVGHVEGFGQHLATHYTAQGPNMSVSGGEDYPYGNTNGFPGTIREGMFPDPNIGGGHMGHHGTDWNKTSPWATLGTGSSFNPYGAPGGGDPFYGGF
ncbi:hypothetical protein LTR56_016508 [Elasticomyces elasticus]|nr:hypothetical protein LTR22_021907 [Elasticomyces elasticus]KAK3632140.1 hypothetical protein LTR56_016508 [Elasticomyces elasticus]KAK4923718.1 hypothetical protein LTR49_009075 [Elasticomyces elasticus]KAK5757523.1 hypothetical protein LTS12_012342 [Elasticomyces elasticus]